MYKLLKDLQNNISMVQRTTDNACIPFDEQNVDYQAYLLWIENGGIPLPAENT
jgi:hypothetical protein